MGLFDKKYCDICGEKIGLLGNRKLEDGNCCKDCAAKLSPWMTDRRSSTVEEIKQHLAYRAQNEASVRAVNPTRVIGNGTKVYVDEEKGQFFVTRFNNWRDRNPDIVPIDKVTACTVDISERKDEIYRKTDDGKRVSYDPPRYEYEYPFEVTIQVDLPWFDEISFELTDTRPDSRYTEEYHAYERQADELRQLLDPVAREQAKAKNALKDAFAQLAAQATAAKAEKEAAMQAAKPAPAKGWKCPACGAQNEGRFCQNCGAKKPGLSYKCDKCGWVPDDPTNPPRFCPQCGDPFNGGDIAG